MEVRVRVCGSVVMTMLRRPPEDPPLVRETTQSRQHELKPGVRLVRSVREVAMVSCEDTDLQDEPRQQGPEQVRLTHEPRCPKEQMEYEKRDSRGGSTAARVHGLTLCHFVRSSESRACDQILSVTPA